MPPTEPCLTQFPYSDIAQIPSLNPLTSLALHFAGFEPGLARGCRFRDSLHRSEPDCGVAALVSDGAISEGRHETYLQILEDLESVERTDRIRKQDR